MKLTDLNALFVHELMDLYDAEHQLIDALPRMADAAHNPDLKRAFQDHLAQTRAHLARLDEAFAACGKEPERQTCKGMKGILTEADKLMGTEAEPDVADAGLIGVAQRVEHYEIAAYGTLVVWARTADIPGALEPLQDNLGEEKAANDALTGIAESGVNAAANETRR